MKPMIILLFAFGFWYANQSASDCPDCGITFTLKNTAYALRHPMRTGARHFGPKADCNNACLDTLSNRYMVGKQYVEMIRQDHAVQPGIGIAIGFEFDEENGEYPYTPAYAVMQVKNFAWGGVEFSRRDTFNYTGVVNDFSDDFEIAVDSFVYDTIYGRFSGLLISGAGPMAPIDSGRFKIPLRRQ